MVASGGDFKRPLGGLLPLYVGKVEFRFTGNPHGWFRPGQNLRAAKVVGKGDEAARRQYVDVGTRPCCLRTAGMRADKPFLLPVSADCSGQDTSHRCYRTVERQLTQNEIGLDRIRWNGANRRHKPDGNGQIIMRPFFRQVSRRQIDRHPLGWHGQAGSVEGRLHPLPAFRHSLVRQADDGHAHLARRHHHLHVDRHSLYALERHRANVLEKLGMRDRVELTRYAIRRGLVEP